MTKKRRMFDIDLPSEEAAADPFPAGKVPDAPARRGPMAAAIAETVQSTRERQEMEALIRIENDALAHEYVRLRQEGLVMQAVPLDQIVTHKLIRDRRNVPDFDLTEMKQSIAALGLSNPIRLEDRQDGLFELVQGFRRLAAYRELLAETGDSDRYGAIPAVVTRPGDDIETLYRKMVDENLVRKDISFAEMAMLALNYVADPRAQERDPERAVTLLFKSANYQKRSYIRSFLGLVRRLGDDLAYPEEVPRALGLALVKRLEEVDGLEKLIRSELKAHDNRSITDELDILRRYLPEGSELEPQDPQAKPAPKVQPPGRLAKAKTSFQFDRRGARVKCLAEAGRLEIQVGRDFTSVDRRRLEAAIATLLDHID